MKRTLPFLAAVLLAFAACGANDRAAPILKLLNSRTSSGPRAYAAAISAVAAEARRGDILHRYIMAVLTDTEDWPEEERLTPADKARYLEASRPRIRALAESDNNPFAWYLLYLENHEEACLQKAVDGGNVQALNTAGTTRLMAALAHPSEPDAASVQETCFGYFKRAAEQNDANGLNNLGLCLQNGYGCAKDEKAALACFRRAARQGHAEAVNNLGRFFREGICVEKDPAAALRCFRLSAGQGNVSGQLNYALSLIRGEGVEADPEKGIGLLEALAERGRIEAMDCLAECYLQGVGSVEANAREAAVWLFRARAARGDKIAAEWLKETHENSDDR